MFTMVHYIQRVGHVVHVTNAVGGMIGQHHVHTLKSYAEWSQSIKPENIIKLTTKTPCTCGLKPGQVKEGRT